MPIYEYQCTQCGHQVEVLQKVSDEPLRQCSACGKDTLTKLISETHFQLKGSGWYREPPKENAGQSSASRSTAGAVNKQSSSLSPGVSENAASAEVKAAGENQAAADKTTSPSKKDD